MKKYLITSLLFVMALVIFANKPLVEAIGPILRSGFTVASMNSANSINSNATTSASYLRNGFGTTTLTIPTDNLDALVVTERVFASTTNISSWLEMKVQASDDNVDYYDYDPTLLNPSTSYVASTTIQLASTTVVWQYKPATRGATTTKAFILPLIPARFTRLTFYEASSSVVTVPVGLQDEMSIFVNLVGKISSTIR